MFNETAYDLAIGAGCSSQGARIAAAIAQAESGGNPRAYNPETAAKGGTPAGMGSYGLWQIYRKVHPEFNGWNLYDPVTNARAMFSVSGGCANWRPWSTYGGGSGAYRAFLGPAAQSGSAGGNADDGSQGSDYDSGSGDNADASSFDVETITQAVPFFSGAPAWLPIAALVAGAWFLLR